LECIEWAHDAGFSDLNIDLIYGTPTLDDDTWLHNLETAKQLGITHLSCYALTVEERTALHHFIQKGKVPPLNDERQAVQFELLMDWAAENQWEHYEISNLCLPGHRSRHNSSYWTGKPYIGFGPSAHSFDGHRTRWMNVANNALYIDAWKQGVTDSYIVEKLTDRDRVNEKIMTGLRRIEGIEVDIENKMVEGHSLEQHNANSFLASINKYVALGYCQWRQHKLCLTRAGKLKADAIAADLFL
ncbi:MAG TPA: hypothetical protein VK907_00310, partial [Phnomibacter sp.]|nr:hypothetical protein [Phnomibacter sp.]